METSEEMALLIVKEQLNCFWVKKMIEEECKNPLAWWKVHEVPYVGFAAQQILGIVGSHIETKSFFNIEGIFTNLKCFQVGIENLKMLVNIYEDWLDDVHVESLTSIG
jgi:hypothetical protein